MRVIALPTLLLVSSLLLPACSMKSEPTTRLVHPNGLMLELPASLDAQQRLDGFLVTPPGARERRSPQQVSITRHLGAARPPGAWPEQKRVAGRAFSYRVEQNEGGSGGEAHVLTAWTPYPGGYVQVEQTVQSEWPATADHGFAWEVMATLGDPGDAGSSPGR